jgi:hypothetical protein
MGLQLPRLPELLKLGVLSQLLKLDLPLASSPSSRYCEASSTVLASSLELVSAGLTYELVRLW